MKKSTSVWEHRRLQCVLLRRYEMTADDAAKIVGLHPGSVRIIWAKWQRGGAEAILGERRGQVRAAARWTREEERAFLEPFLKAAERGTLTTVREVYTAQCERTGKTLDPTATYRLLGRHGWRKIAPRPQHPKTDKKAQETFKVFFPRIITMGRIAALLCGLRFRLMFSDEGRFGRITDPHDCWAPPGIRPVTRCQVIREYTYAYAAVSPADGELDTLILPNMYTSTFSVFLAEVSSRHPDDFILWIHDGAPSHRSGTLVVPANIRIVELPPYSPELNPVEHLWEEMREKEFWNSTFKSMRAVERAMVRSLRRLEEDKALVQSMTSFPWVTRCLQSH